MFEEVDTYLAIVIVLEKTYALDGAPRHFQVFGHGIGGDLFQSGQRIGSGNGQFGVASLQRVPQSRHRLATRLAQSADGRHRIVTKHGVFEVLEQDRQHRLAGRVDLSQRGGGGAHASAVVQRGRQRRNGRPGCRADAAEE